MARRGVSSMPLQQRRFSQQHHGGRARIHLPRFTFRNFVSLVLVLVVLSYVPSVYQRYFQKPVHCDWLRSPPMVCAHGGDSSRAPPNTRAAFQLALDAGVDCVEIDASRTRDGVLLALHDRDLQRMMMTEHIGNTHVGDFTSHEIQKLDASIGKTITFADDIPEQRVPTVEDAIQFVQRSLKQIIIDAKVGPPLFEERLPADLISTLRRTACRNCVVWAKEDRIVAEIIRQSAMTKTGYIVLNDSVTGKVSELFRFDGADVVGIYYELVTKTVVREMHRAGKKVHAWTVNTAGAMIDMLKIGVDAIITNDPKMLQQVLKEQKQLCILDGFSAF